MSNLIKRWGIIATIAVSCCILPGCNTGSKYHDGSSKDWILEQVEQGKLTQEQANELLKQEE